MFTPADRTLGHKLAGEWLGHHGSDIREDLVGDSGIVQVALELPCLRFEDDTEQLDARLVHPAASPW